MLIDKLHREARTFSFLKMAELIETYLSKDKSVYYRANASFGFPSSDINRFSKLANGSYEVEVNFMGLYGPSSPLPDHFTQAVIDEQVEVERSELNTFYLRSISELRAYQEQRVNLGALKKRREHDLLSLQNNISKKVILTDKQLDKLKALWPVSDILTREQYNAVETEDALIEINLPANSNQRDFLDLFNHRFVSLFIEASKKYRSYQSLDIQDDKNCNVLFSLMGIERKTIQKNSAIDWTQLLKVAGLITLRSGSIEVIRKVIAIYFNFELEQVCIEENVLRSVAVPQIQLNSLGLANAELGSTFICGTTVMDKNSKFRLHLKGLDRERFRQFLPAFDETNGESRYPELVELLNFLKPAELVADISLKPADNTNMGMKLSAQQPACLGYTSWLDPSITQDCHVIV